MKADVVAPDRAPVRPRPLPLTVIETDALDSPRRHGEVVEVIGQGEREHCRVHWHDGHESVVFPGPDARVLPPG